MNGLLRNRFHEICLDFLDFLEFLESTDSILFWENLHENPDVSRDLFLETFIRWNLNFRLKCYQTKEHMRQLSLELFSIEFNCTHQRHAQKQIINFTCFFSVSRQTFMQILFQNVQEMYVNCCQMLSLLSVVMMVKNGGSVENVVPKISKDFRWKV